MRFARSLAQAAGASAKTWRAYLSTTGAKSVNARDRIGRGPWQNAKGAVIARTLDDLHSDKNNLNKETALTETGQVVNGCGDKPNMHDILTGSTAEGRAVSRRRRTRPAPTGPAADAGSAIVGHHDRQGIEHAPPANTSWNSSHPTKGCSQQGAGQHRRQRPLLLLRGELTARFALNTAVGHRCSAADVRVRRGCYCAGAKALA